MGNVFNRYGAGGGKSEGIYIWKKSITTPTEKSTSITTTDTYASGVTSMKLYKASSYTFADGKYKLVNSTLVADFVNVNRTVTLEGLCYYIIGGTENTVMYKAGHTGISGYAGYISLNYNDTTITATAYSSSYPLTKYTVDNELSLIGYVVSDKEDAYPDKEVKDGYYYERYSALEPALFGCTKYETGAVSVTTRVPTVTVSHSMGVKPKFAFVWKSRAQGTQYCRAVAITYSDDGIYCAMSNWGNSGSNTNSSVYNTASGVSTLSDVTLVSDPSNNYYKFYSGGYSYILLG